MRSKAIFMALLALAFGAQAERVMPSQAKVAAKAWVGSKGAVLGSRLGVSVGEAIEHPVVNGYSFYEVQLDQGTLFLTSETEFEPVIGFTDRKAVDLSEKSPLAYLLRHDIALRAALREQSVAKGGGSSAQTSAGVSQSGAQGKWAVLLGSAKVSSGSDPQGLSAVSADPVDSVDDLRVKPLVKTQWNQNADKSGAHCFDLNTPENIACGCTATAAAQIMRFFRWPLDEVEASKVECVVNGTKTELDVVGGLYNWDMMPPDDGSEKIEEDDQRTEIGHLTSDIGVALGTDYSHEKGGSAQPENLGRLYRDTFHYANGYVFWDGHSYSSGNGGLHELWIREKVIYANLDAGRPVQLAIYGYPKANLGDKAYWSGHSVVGDGYGYKTINGLSTPFVHINMGWGGTDDMWYNIPEINAANSGAHVGDSGYDFLYMGGAMFNLSTNAPGCEIVSGRVTHFSGRPIRATVTASDTEGNVVATTESDDLGIYAFELPGGCEYVISSEQTDGGTLLMAKPITVTVMRTEGDEKFIVADSAKIGNSWGNDLVLKNPSVAIGDVLYNTLDEALVAARKISGSDPVDIRILRPTTLIGNFANDFDCAISATNDNPSASVVTRIGDAALKVQPGRMLSLSNVVFAASAEPVVTVDAGGRLSLAGKVVFGVPAARAAVRTSDADGLLIGSPITDGFTLDCTASVVRPYRFGIIGWDDATATNCAAKIANLSGDYGEVRGTIDEEGGVFHLAWSDVPVPVEDSVGYFVTEGGAKTNTAARLDRLFEKFEKASGSNEIVLREMPDLSLSHKLTVSGDLTIRGEGDVVISEISSSAGFVISGGTLTVDGITFENADYQNQEMSLFTVDGGKLVLGHGVTVRNVRGNSYYSAALHVKKGKATVDGAKFENCRNLNTSNYAGGGAIYVGGVGCELVLDGGCITGCSAVTRGGGVFAYNSSTVTIGGDLTVKGNTSGTNPAVDDDVFIGGSRVVFTLADGGLTGGRESCVGIRYGTNDGNEIESSFIAANDPPPPVIADSAYALFNDVHPEYEVDVADDAKSLIWAEASAIDYSTTDPDRTKVRIIRAGSDVDGKMYPRIEYALDALALDGTSAATIEILADVGFANDFAVDFPLTIRAAGSAVRTITRTGDVGIKVSATGKLVLEDVIFNGGDGTVGLFEVEGGSLTLGDGTTVTGVMGSKNGAASAIMVWRDGVFLMESGSVISNCVNRYWNPGIESGYGGAVQIKNGTAMLTGGCISNCAAGSAGGVFAHNGSKVFVSGNVVIDGNANLADEADDLRVSDDSELILAGKFTGLIGYTESALGSDSDPNVFGVAGFSGTPADIADSARQFRHDLTGDRGQAVSGNGKTLLVWSVAVKNGKYTAPDGKVYTFVDAGTPMKIAKPIPASSLRYDGTEKIGVKAGVGYAQSGTVSATEPGSYAVTNTLNAGFAWEDGSTDQLILPWTIEKGVYDLGGITFVCEYDYDGTSKKVVLEGELPAGLQVALVGNEDGRIDAGEYQVIAKFTGDADRYDPIPDQELTLKINKAAYDMRGVVFADTEFTYDGTPKSIFVETDTLPAGVVVTSYVGNAVIGSNASNEIFTVTALFAGDERNHLSVDPLAAELRINRNPDLPLWNPGHDPTPVPCPSFAFTGIERKTDGTVVLTISPVVQYCTYTLRVSDDLTTWTDVESKTCEADGDLTFTLAPTEAQKFWWAEGKDGEKPAE